MLLDFRWHRLARLQGQAEYAITDSPLPLSLIYGSTDDMDWLEPLVHRLWTNYDNFPFLLKRSASPFVQHGRNQNLQEAMELDNRIHQLAIEQFKTEHTVDPDHPDCVDYMIRYVNWGRRLIT